MHKKDEVCNLNDDGNTNRNKVETTTKPEKDCSEKVEEVEPKSDDGLEKLLILEPIWTKR